MRKFLLYSTILVAFTMSGGAAEAACIQTPSCSSLGYTSSQSCNGGIKCPFGNAWNCTASDLSTQITELTNKITEQTNKITEITNKITTIEEKIVTIENGASSSNCIIGDILYSDKSCDPSVVVSKKPIGVVFDQANRLAIALDTENRPWLSVYKFWDVPSLPNIASESVAVADWQGKNNTRLAFEHCKANKANGYDCPAFWYVNSYKTEGTLAGDWYLPAMGELNAIYQNIYVLNTALGTIGGTELPLAGHWSSSEGSNYGAWSLGFDNGNAGNGDKIGDWYVRPVLAF